MNSEADWTAVARRFQQDVGANWTKALQSFAPAAGPGAAPLRFSPDKLADLRDAYLREAAQLWNQGLAVNPAAAAGSAGRSRRTGS